MLVADAITSKKVGDDFNKLTPKLPSNGTNQQKTQAICREKAMALVNE